MHSAQNVLSSCKSAQNVLSLCNLLSLCSQLKICSTVQTAQNTLSSSCCLLKTCYQKYHHAACSKHAINNRAVYSKHALIVQSVQNTLDRVSNQTERLSISTDSWPNSKILCKTQSETIHFLKTVMHECANGKLTGKWILTHNLCWEGVYHGAQSWIRWVRPHSWLVLGRSVPWSSVVNVWIRPHSWLVLGRSVPWSSVVNVWIRWVKPHSWLITHICTEKECTLGLSCECASQASQALPMTCAGKEPDDHGGH